VPKPSKTHGGRGVGAKQTRKRGSDGQCESASDTVPGTLDPDQETPNTQSQKVDISRSLPRCSLFSPWHKAELALLPLPHGSQNLRASAGLPAVHAMGLQTTPLASYLALMRGQGVEIHPGANFCTKM